MLFIAVLILGFLEVVGIASVLPFMELLSKPDAIAKSSWLKWAYVFFGFEDEKSFLIASGGFVIFVISLSGLFSVVTNYFQLRFSWDLSHRMGMNLLKQYIKKTYSYFLTQNTADLRAYLIAEVAAITSGVFVPLLEFISRSVICLVIFLLLLTVSPQVTITMVLFLGGAYGLIYLSRQQFLKRLGSARIEANTARYKYLEEMLTGIKTLKIFGVEESFQKRYERVSEDFSTIHPKVQMTYITPKYLLETIAFGGILGVTLYLYTTTGDLNKSIPRLSLYAVAGYRLLPSLQRAFASIAKVKYNMPSLHKLYSDLKSSASAIDGEEEKSPMPFQEKIRFNKVSFRYDNADVYQAKELDVTIKKGSTVAFVGSTGSGKTTIADLLTGLLIANKGGSVEVDGITITEENARTWQKNIAYVPQEVFLYDDTVKANVAFGVAEEDIDNILLEKALKMAEVYDFVSEELAHGVDTKIGERGVRLSGGQRQRLGLARALYRQPSLLVLDEATSALDSVTEKEVIESLKSLPSGITTVVIAHRMSTVRYADLIFLVEKGEVAARGTYDELIAANDQFKQMAVPI